MPKIQIVSDAHFEFMRDAGESFVHDLTSDADILVVAGDLAPCKQLLPALGMLCKHFPQVVFVSGNHEFYNSSPAAIAKLRSQATKQLPNLHWLEESTTTIQGQRFVGTTLWFPTSPVAMMHREMLNDFAVIQHFNPWVFEKNSKAVSFLSKTVNSGDVVITHHAPSPRSTNPKYLGSPLNEFFVCDVEGLLETAQPKLWVHGHMHDSNDYKVGDTRVLNNPFGYACREENKSFQWKLILDL